jgi:hypothetical protein
VEPGTADCLGSEYGEVNPPAPLGTDAPERGGAAVAKSGAMAKVGPGREVRRLVARGRRKNGRGPTPPLVQIRPADRIDSPCDWVKSAVGKPVLDRRRAETERQQLSPRHHPVLAPDQSPCLLISRLRH